MTTPTTPPPVVHTASPTCACEDCARVRECDHPLDKQDSRLDGHRRCVDCGGVGWHPQPVMWRWPGPVAQPAPTAEGGKLAEAIEVMRAQARWVAEFPKLAGRKELAASRVLAEFDSLRTAQAEHAAAWAAAHEHERAAAVAGRERDEARAEVDKLKATAQRSFDRAKRDGLDIDDGHDGYVDWGWTGKVEVAGTMYGVNELVEQVAALRAELASPPTEPPVHLPAPMAELRAVLVEVTNRLGREDVSGAWIQARMQEAMRLLPAHDDRKTEAGR